MTALPEAALREPALSVTALPEAELREPALSVTALPEAELSDGGPAGTGPGGAIIVLTTGLAERLMMELL